MHQFVAMPVKPELCNAVILVCINFRFCLLASKVGRSKPPPVLTSGLNRPGQYSLKWPLLVNTHESG